MRFIFLRMVSFNVDYYWALNGTGEASGWHLKQLERYTEKERDDIASGGGPYGWRKNHQAIIGLQLHGIFEFHLLHH